MPNPHFDVRIISRGAGRSAVASASYRSGSRIAAPPALRSVVASASYRSGELLRDERAGKTFDYTRKEDVLYKDILVPDGAPTWTHDRQALWNQVEAVEKRKDAQLARDIIAALPRELDRDQQIALLREFVEANFVAKGMIADVAIHDKLASDGGTNPHAHIMLTLRDVDAAGFGKKNRDWNKLDLVSHWRNAWEQVTNHYLEAFGRQERVSLQRLDVQGIDRTPERHMGVEAWNLEEKGVETTKGNQNRRIRHRNNLRDIARDYAPEPEPATESAPVPESQNLRQISQHLETPPAGAATRIPHLARVSANLSDTTGSATADDPDARMRHEQTLRAIVATKVHRTLQAGGELINRIKMATRAVIDKATGTRREEAAEEAMFDRYAHLAALADSQKRIRDHER
jgi:hypothetical protein